MGLGDFWFGIVLLVFFVCVECLVSCGGGSVDVFCAMLGDLC